MSFVLGRGECLALFGPNGAGKTTLLRLLGGLLRPDTGSVTLEGSRIGNGTSLRARVGFISHRTMLYPALTALENIVFTAKMYGLDNPRVSAMEVLGKMGIERTNVPVRMLSRGMQQRVSIARATVNRPSILLGDEPYSGLDEAGASALTLALRDLKTSGAALVIVTHQLSEGLDLADRVAVMRDGRFIRHESAEDMNRAEYASQYRRLVTADA